MARVLWTQKQDIGPRARVRHAMAYDVARQRITLFGGDSLDGTLRSGTWEWDGQHWTQVQNMGPAGRTGHAMAHDAARSRTVLFGGRTAAGPVGDTWEWDGGHWTQVADSGPSPRSGHVLAFDGARRRVVLFGGEGPDGSFFNDTWHWDGLEWVQQEDTGPSSRTAAALAFDASRGRLVLFGGAEAGGAALGDTWEWDGVTWTQATDFGPEACAGGALAFNGAGVSLYGGITTLAPGADASLSSLTWDWNGRHWTARQDMGPGPRFGHALAFDTVRARVVLFGGLSTSPLAGDAAQHVHGDTWEQIRTASAGITADLAALEVSPNPAEPGQEITLTVVLVTAVAAAVQVELLAEGAPDPFALLTIPPNEMASSVQLTLPPDIPAGDYGLLARSGSSQVSATLTIAGS
jgi:hypothetical protein